MISNNNALLIGRIENGYDFSHNVHGEKFYIFKISVERNSGYVDIIHVMVSDRLVDNLNSLQGKYAEIQGQFRSYNKNNKLLLYVFARNIKIFDENEETFKDKNLISLEGFICKKPTYRETSLSGRKIAEILLAVNRPYRNSDYIPTIVWGRNASYAAEKLEVGDSVLICGRIQSREYRKKLENDEYESRIAFEVSAKTIELSTPEEWKDAEM